MLEWKEEQMGGSDALKCFMEDAEVVFSGGWVSVCMLKQSLLTFLMATGKDAKRVGLWRIQIWHLFVCEIVKLSVKQSDSRAKSICYHKGGQTLPAFTFLEAVQLHQFISLISLENIISYTYNNYIWKNIRLKSWLYARLYLKHVHHIEVAQIQSWN